MIIDTNKLENKILAHFKDENSFVELRVKVSYNQNSNTAEVTIKREYDFINFDFEFLEKLSRLFQTKKIDVGNRQSYGGCETCDHGSSYEITFHIRECGSTEQSKTENIS